MPRPNTMKVGLLGGFPKIGVDMLEFILALGNYRFLNMIRTNPKKGLAYKQSKQGFAYIDGSVLHPEDISESRFHLLEEQGSRQPQ